MSGSADKGQGRFLGYVRVSVADQHLDLQLDALRAVGGPNDLIYADHGVSGARARRPGLDLLLEEAREGDTLICWRLDRLGRSLVNLSTLASTLTERDIRIRTIADGVDRLTRDRQASAGSARHFGGLGTRGDPGAGDCRCSSRPSRREGAGAEAARAGEISEEQIGLVAVLPARIEPVMKLRERLTDWLARHCVPGTAVEQYFAGPEWTALLAQAVESATGGDDLRPDVTIDECRTCFKIEDDEADRLGLTTLVGGARALQTAQVCRGKLWPPGTA
ncbi:recombinase family protein [Phaeovibrio sulfidiphilus]|uniref:Recombinase family protein n=1 Tax=Phaeovibrio sulfidiphilus TaxID=1220600 RepID=A0A8J7CPN2_9PROT|nr:recombinase family protein [Phaeovibrio sulfidiphilus]MBE1237217.1 recombinase family protein [Phaeovibrio sulfidiphilus]